MPGWYINLYPPVTYYQKTVFLITFSNKVKNDTALRLLGAYIVTLTSVDFGNPTGLDFLA